jgi:hypothetical protein
MHSMKCLAVWSVNENCGPLSLIFQIQIENCSETVNIPSVATVAECQVLCG